jgi:hypothetical protein
MCNWSFEEFKYKIDPRKKESLARQDFINSVKGIKDEAAGEVGDQVSFPVTEDDIFELFNIFTKKSSQVSTIRFCQSVYDGIDALLCEKVRSAFERQRKNPQTIF